MKLPTLDLQASPLQEGLGDPYLKLRLSDSVPVALPMEAAREVIVVPVEQISPIPNMPTCVLGLLNQRSRVFWVVDLSIMLGYSGLMTNARQYNVAILQVGQVPLGLAVPIIQGVTRFPSDTIQSPIGTVAPNIAPYLRGCLPEEKEILLVLDPDAIVNSSVLQR
ncbi:chemotaxis protein CheW [Acaryochloris sp. CCMEE 5410]|uniref:chemotaxis protein CheW n=1 Tax=Acaryochloris sp. CCMEE 5410 TaxID=310037 RepID=UPI000248480E|nr:chemotaxis protein CheW [Acaryochloris sp. CCMEE 5410]KAI9131081.1 purine-binding chemotaxis protein CheW [Acaryochloris sp. CCMEE 5410]